LVLMAVPIWILYVFVNLGNFLNVLSIGLLVVISGALCGVYGTFVYHVRSKIKEKAFQWYEVATLVFFILSYFVGFLRKEGWWLAGGLVVGN